ncbi:DegV family protein [Alcanivorax sp. JB21]|uniref:DegV family protein n=1 Tax=Alcanivorax limicola TaxID=2874102 RepID=UPI001CBA78A8|nr:DegV family protein [Alcanivorax limicola]MBZ2187928.1 DegV family protein [Alcanivorax limicola]
MRIGIVVDSTCDLPATFYSEHDIRIMPISIRLGDELLVDERDAAATQHFYTSQLDAKGIDSESIPYDSKQIQAVFLERLVIDFDLVFCITVSSKRSLIFDNATSASFGILKKYRDARAAAAVSGPFSMRVIDSKTIFAGTAVLVAEAAGMIKAGIQPNEIRLKIDQMIPDICGFMVPADLAYVRNRGFKKGTRKSLADTMRGVALTVGSALSLHPIIKVYRGQEDPATVNRSYEKSVRKMLEHVAARIEAGDVRSGSICLSYAGDISAVPDMEGFKTLDNAARKAGLTLHLSTMSATGAVNVGAGCLFVAYAGDPGEL